MTALRQEALSMLEQCPEEKLAMLLQPEYCPLSPYML